MPTGGKVYFEQFGPRQNIFTSTNSPNRTQGQPQAFGNTLICFRMSNFLGRFKGVSLEEGKASECQSKDEEKKVEWEEEHRLKGSFAARFWVICRM